MTAGQPKPTQSTNTQHDTEGGNDPTLICTKDVYLGGKKSHGSLEFSVKCTSTHLLAKQMTMVQPGSVDIITNVIGS